MIEQLAIGDAIRSIAIEGADEEALAAAIARETPRPPTPQEALAAIERERAERAASATDSARASRGGGGRVAQLAVFLRSWR